MSNSISVSKLIFSKSFKDFGEIKLRYINLDTDIEIIHNWVTKPYAKYWGMEHMTLEGVNQSYKSLQTLKHHEVFIGTHNDKPIFLMEKYKASEDRIAKYYDTADGDYGMHVLVAPPKKKIHGFTWHIFTTILDYFFSQNEVSRIIVEPDITNEKIHILNKKAGFQYQKEIELPEKKAALAFCDRKHYKLMRNAETN